MFIREVMMGHHQRLLKRPVNYVMLLWFYRGECMSEQVMYFEYGEAETEYLRSKCARLALGSRRRSGRKKT